MSTSIERRQKVHHTDHAIAPREELLLDGQRADVEMLVSDFKPLDWVQDDGHILKAGLDGGHGEDSVKRQKGLAAAQGQPVRPSHPARMVRKIDVIRTGCRPGRWFARWWGSPALSIW
ncbi:hypothetical protein PQQ99_36775 [Paraburkholderia sediminicola]|uniref:hypothetical protein n=1 Tax=Paraburkholderia sediminicola TaxID=458836 RepID=UPI0038BB4BAB